MNKMFSALYRPTSGRGGKAQLIAQGEALKKSPGFSHYRLLKPDHQYVLLTFWHSRRYFLQAVGERGEV